METTERLERLKNLSPAKRALLLKALQQEAAHTEAAQRIPRRPGQDFYPLSFAQQRLWFLEQLDPASPAYNIPLALRLHGEMQERLLAQALTAILQRHEVLRTTVATRDGQPVQVIAPAQPVNLPVVDLTALPLAARAAEVRRLITAEALKPFDLANGPLLRTTLLKLAATEHVFLLTVHHIAADAWSLEVFFRELQAFYHAFTTAQPAALPELPIQYADFAVWQREWLQGEVLEKQLAYWRQQLAGAPPLLALPTDRPRPAVQTLVGAQSAFAFSKELSAALQQLSQQKRVTLFMTLLAGFATLLYRYTGQEDIVVGSPIANRNRAELEDLIGFFVNTLVLRTNLRGNPTFAELLDRVNATALAAYAHQDVPFEKLVEELRPERNLSTSPFFQTMFIYQNVPRRDMQLPGLQFEALASPGGTAKFDLTLTLYEQADGLAGVMEYNTDLFDAATIQRLLGHYERLLQSIVADPDQRLAELPLLNNAEQQQLLQTWNDTQTAPAYGQDFHRLFEAQVERTPEAIAVAFEGQQLTYRELNRRANQLAHHLSRHYSVGPEVLVGICLERSLEMTVGLLGILKAGGAYVPLDPAYPAERIAYVLADARTPVLLSQQATIADFNFSLENLQLICLDSDWDKIASESDTNLPVAVDPENLAYVIYTSGSTGKPKGVAIPRRALINFLEAMQTAPGMTPQEVLLAVTTLSFDIAGLELYLPLIAGARVVVASREIAADGRRLMSAVENFGATMMQATPATWRMLLEMGWRGGAGLKILCGGEALPPELAQQLLERCTELWNMYGPTETTIWSTVKKLEKSDGVPLCGIGRPIANTQIYLLDRYLQIVPLGVHGGLHIGGDGLARGYLQRPDLTAEKFIPHPFLQSPAAVSGLRLLPAARIYNTGDLARYLPDGEIDCLGRVDQQVKIRGFRVELGEIETVGSQHAAIAQMVVVARDTSASRRSGGEGKRLVAYFVAKTEPAPTAGELREFLLQKLPDYMVPAVFVNLPALPLTPNGKIDRRALPAPEYAASQPETAYVAPQNLVEELLTEIWEEVLVADRVGVTDNFFELGGHSLLAVRLFVEIERSFHRSLPLASIFKAPTIKQLAALLAEAEPTADAGCLIALQEEGGQPPLFCVSGYEGHTFNFRQLARHLGHEQPVYGLHYPGLDGQEQPLDTVEDIAAEFISHVRRVQPHGPYYLCGLCFGGLVVYEMARQLARQGENVPKVILLDTIAPGGAQLVPAADEAAPPAAAADRAEPFLAADSALAQWIAAVRAANIRAHERYPAKSYSGGVIVFLPKKRREFWQNFIIDPLNGWGRLAQGGVETYEVGGRHVKWFREPKIQRFAKKMRACLREERNEQFSAVEENVWKN
ncbi:MAG: D-alanine--poly(phosphoribitol) ligase subunit 1 [bacterium]|nr:D-alanine--poly(phosphoribitol) ligase subunit 1 [bacterium]